MHCEHIIITIDHVGVLCLWADVVASNMRVLQNAYVYLYTTVHMMCAREPAGLEFRNGFLYGAI